LKGQLFKTSDSLPIVLLLRSPSLLVSGTMSTGEISVFYGSLSAEAVCSFKLISYIS
jgi:hypothetical protein